MDIFSKKSIHFISLIPLLVLLFATLSSPWTHLIFYIDEANKYHRGALHTLQVICMNIYCIIPCFIAFIKSRNKNDIANLNKYSSLCFFILWELAAQVFQIFNSGYPAMSAGISMAMLSCHLRMKDASVSLDPLTQINNRNQLLNHMAYRLKSLPMYIQEDSEKKLYLMIMDANLFKQINDNYGHIEGDEALKLIATALKKTVVVTGGFICRYGGDEFMLITEKKNDAEMDDVKVMFNDNLKTVVGQANKPYPLTASSGYARLTETITTFDALVEAADAIMYEEKQKNRQAR